jgi:hypothetical protein
MSDNPPTGTPLEQARHRAARRVELAAEAATALDALAETFDPARPEPGCMESNRLAFAADKLLGELRQARPR